MSAAFLPFAGLLAPWPFVFDTTFTLLRRWRRGENIFAAHRSHLYQRLVIAGWRHRDVTLLYLWLALLAVALLPPGAFHSDATMRPCQTP